MAVEMSQVGIYLIKPHLSDMKITEMVRLGNFTNYITKFINFEECK